MNIATLNPVFLPAAPQGRLIYAVYVCSLLEGLRAGKHTPDMIIFDLLQGDAVAEYCQGIMGDEILWKAFDADTLLLSEDGCPLNDVSKLPEVSRPVVSLESLKRLFGKPRKV